MWLWDINNINFIVGYKKDHSFSTKEFFISLAMGYLIDQETQNSNIKSNLVRITWNANRIGHILCRNIIE
jgi:hypothetical protein